jgi:hypothetical protein
MKPACRAVEGAVEVHNLAADRGGMSFVEHLRAECLRSTLLNTRLIEAAWLAGVQHSDGQFIWETLNWEPSAPLATGMQATCKWIEQLYSDRKAGKRVVRDQP